MDRERDIIRIFMQNQGKEHADPDFEKDAISIKMQAGEMLFSTDEFSREDHFRSCHPFDLGWNLAAATQSDIYAAGGEPVFYGHAVTVQSDWDDDYIRKFSSGIAACLSETGVAAIGGDLGIAEQWRYTGIVLGKKIAPLSRRGASPGDTIYMTGTIGAGNLEAALRLYSGKPALAPLLNRVHICFPVRSREAALVRKYANCCIDSSDGVFRAVLDLAKFCGSGFLLGNLVYHKQGLAACTLLGKPAEILFLGECGEYELVFTVSPENENKFLKEAKASKLRFNRLGIITSDKELKINKGDHFLNLNKYEIYARNFSDVKEYISEAVKFIENGRK